MDSRLQTHQEALALKSKIDSLPTLSPDQAKALARQIKGDINRVGIQLLRTDGHPVLLKVLGDGSRRVNSLLEDSVFTVATKRVLKPKDLGPCTLVGYRSWEFRVPPEYQQQKDSPISLDGRIKSWRQFHADLDENNIDGLARTEINDILMLLWPADFSSPTLNLNNLAPQTANTITAQHPWTLGDDVTELSEKVNAVKRHGDPDAAKKRKAFGYWWSLSDLHTSRLQHLHQTNGLLPPRSFSILSQEQGHHRLSNQGQSPTLDFRDETFDLNDQQAVTDYFRGNIDDILTELEDAPLKNGRDKILDAAHDLGYDLINESITPRKHY